MSLIEILTLLGIYIPIIIAIFTFQYKLSNTKEASAKWIRNALIFILISITALVIIYKTSTDEGDVVTKNSISPNESFVQIPVETNIQTSNEKSSEPSVNNSLEPYETNSEQSKSQSSTYPSATLTIAPEEPAIISTELFIQIKLTVMQKEWLNGGLSNYGYNIGTSNDIYLTGEDESYNVMWTNTADYIDNGLYMCRIPSTDYNITVSGFNGNSHLIYSFNTGFFNTVESAYVMHCNNESLIEINWVKGSMDEVAEIVSLEYEMYQGYEPFIVSDPIFDEEIKSIKLLPGDYRINYEDGTNAIISIYTEGIYDFSKS